MQNSIDWTNVGFMPRKTNAIAISYYRDGKWSAPELISDFNFSLSIFAGSLHYANSCFEGLKAFRGADGKVRLFRPYENAHRLAGSAAYLDMACPSEEMFVQMCLSCVKANLEFLPPYGYESSLYVRPLLIGINPQLNLNSSTDLLFAVMCTPVGAYSSGLKPVTAILSRNYDRSAPNGTGRFKLSANYAMSMHPYNLAHRIGYGELLYPDSATKTKVDEFGSSNFIAIKGKKYVTPLSDTVLPSITNKSLRQLAEDEGLTVEVRPVPLTELDEFDEVNACGTAVVITPVCKIDDRPTMESPVVTRTWTFGSPDRCGATSQRLYDRIRGIQNGTEQDVFNWCVEL